MLRFSANLTTLFSDLPFEERYAAAAEAGFSGVECLFPYQADSNLLSSLLRDHGLEQVLINAPAGNWEAGERGLACLPERDDDFIVAVDLAMKYAQALGCQQVHIMAGVVEGLERGLAEDVYVRRLQQAADTAAAAGRTVLIEPINSKDMPDYFLNSFKQANVLLEKIDRDNVRLQLDLYHAQIIQGDLTSLVKDVIDSVAHIQVASVPYRNEPVDGEIDFNYLFDLIDDLGYKGWVGLEYHPRKQTVDGLRDLARWLG